ncbi:uncharacterized protein A4U43_C07F13380 [Asparagus officinalis]|uniref:PHD-type domain-containing protein n=1 Tax=Asparagus officinalis TaxID=4686 RepID=A0A5P1EBU1_ASPOF|nr:chromodomain-helicase-DNA-binding protein 5-like [Asparagus officinalis]ONK63284.1 uncharacterized protein A4U43_C07F13380 [Asparagus officinalis]
MARGGRVIYKKPNNGSRKRKPRSKDDEEDDDGDEEYLIEEDEDEESESNYESDVNSRDLSDEESFEFDESDGESEIARSPKKKQRGYKKPRVSDDEVTEDLPKRGRGRAKKRESRDSDYEFDEEEDEDEDFSPDEDDFDEDEGLLVSKRRGAVKNVRKRRRSKVSKTKGRKKGRSNALPARKRQKRTIGSSDDDDDDFVVKDRVLVGRKRTKRTNKRSSVDSESLNSYFVTSDDDFVKKDIALINKQRKNKKTAAKKTVKKKMEGPKKWRKKRSAEDSESSDSDFVVSDDDFDLEDDFNYVQEQIVVDKRQTKNEKQKDVGFNDRKRRKRVVDSSDSDYLISENDDEFLIEDEFLIDKERNQSKKTRGKRTGPKTKRKRSNSLVDSDSESLDVDEMTLEEEVMDLRRGGLLMIEQPKRVTATKKAEEKGKERQVDSSGKQVCGVCLSEEKKSVIQGLLNCCSHYFCFACIMEWSKVESRCPLCKRRFETITKLGRSDPEFGMSSSAVVRVQKRDQVYQPSEEELRGMLDPYENVVCMECQQGGDDNLMLLCDICDSSAHTYCVGLGREVPEGNWYCECCRSVNEAASQSQFQETTTGQEPINNSFFSATSLNVDSPRPVSLFGCPSSLRIDLNASPRDFPGDNHFVPSPISGSGASTLMGRRHIRQRIHVILSTDRQRRTPTRTNTSQPSSVATIAENWETSPMAGNLSLPSLLGFQQQQQNPRPFFHTHTNLAPCMLSEGSSLRHVDGAKEEVRKMVRHHLKDLAKNRTVDHSTFKEIARNSTHTILAACGIEHRRSMVTSVSEPPDNCVHDSDDGPEHLLKGCCSSCFNSFVKDVVRRLIDTKT